MEPKLNISHFYGRNPPSFHMTGDIWKDLPTMGLLNCSHCSGIVITPSCDLANNKVETVTYLPIIPVRDWYCSRSFYPILRQNLISLLNGLQIPYSEMELPKNNLPLLINLEQLQRLLSESAGKSKAGSKELEGLKRCIIGTQLIGNVIKSERSTNMYEDLVSFISQKSIDKINNEIIRNSHSSDLYFLPEDKEDVDWSVIPRHSVVLFRYPITAPIEVFDLAQDPTVLNWESAVKEIGSSFPAAMSFIDKQPLKVLSLKSIFLSELLTRYISLYVRIGSPDFTSDSIRELSKHI